MKKIFVILVLFAAVSVYAQGAGSVGASSAVAAGMGKTYTAAAKGIYSVGINPSNLVYMGSGDVQIATVLPLPNLNIGVGTDFITIEDYNYFFGGTDAKDANGNTIGRTLTPADKERLMSLFEDGGNVVADASVTLLSISLHAGNNVGAFAFSINDVVSMNLNLPSDIVDFALHGNPIGKVYNFDETKAKSWWLRNYSLSYARDITEIPQNIFQRISAGITLKYVQGISYAGIEHVKSTLQTQQDYSIVSNGDMLAYSAFSPDFNVKYDFDSTNTDEDGSVGPFPKPAGTGIGFDIGFSAQLDDIWSFGLAITDIGSVKWTENVARFTSNSAFYMSDLTDKEEFDSLRENFLGKGEFYSEFSTPLPTALRMGATFQLDRYMGGNFPGTLLIAADYNQGFNDQPGNSKNPRLSLGTEWCPASWLPIRTGFSFGGITKFNWAFGFGLDAGTVEFNFATPDFHYLFMANNAKRVSLAIGTIWKF